MSIANALADYGTEYGQMINAGVVNQQNQQQLQFRNQLLSNEDQRRTAEFQQNTAAAQAQASLAQHARELSAVAALPQNATPDTGIPILRQMGIQIDPAGEQQLRDNWDTVRAVAQRMNPPKLTVVGENATAIDETGKPVYGGTRVGPSGPLQIPPGASPGEIQLLQQGVLKPSEQAAMVDRILQRSQTGANQAATLAESTRTREGNLSGRNIVRATDVLSQEPAIMDAKRIDATWSDLNAAVAARNSVVKAGGETTEPDFAIMQNFVKMVAGREIQSKDQLADPTIFGSLSKRGQQIATKLLTGAGLLPSDIKAMQTTANSLATGKMQAAESAFKARTPTLRALNVKPEDVRGAIPTRVYETDTVPPVEASTAQSGRNLTFNPATGKIE